VRDVDWIFHLAGVNRPQSSEEFWAGNLNLTEQLISAVELSGRQIRIVFSSSIQAELDNEYGRSKLAAEHSLLEFQRNTGNPVHIYRLPNVFGKWSRPNYNSVVATFCHNIANDLPITVNDPSALVRLVYVDDVVDSFVQLLASSSASERFPKVAPEYQTTVGELAAQIQRFKDSRQTLLTDAVGDGLLRALYSTYLSFLPASAFSYPVPQHEDARGVFVEMLKTPDAGQISFFTAHPGVTRGGHYHHTKTEKFLVIKGEARFRFRHMITGEFYELQTSGASSEIVETVPGWTHDITNVGDQELLCMLWANEVFDRDRPDTYAAPVESPTGQQ